MTGLAAALARILPAAATPADEAALDGHLDDMVRFYGRGCALVLNLLHLLFWPTDLYLLPADPRIHHIMNNFRASTFVVHGLLLLALQLPRLARAPLLLFSLAVAASSALFARAMAQLGGLDTPFFFMTYLAPLGLGAMPARPLQRLCLSPVCGLVLCLAYFLTRPSQLGSPLLGAALGCMAFVVMISLTIGHAMYLLTRRAFLTGRALDHSRTLLKEYNEHLEDKVADYALQLRRLANYREQAAAQERARLAQDLHDEVGQQLIALRYGLAAARARCQERGLATELGELDQDLGHLGDSVRALVADLRPRVLEERGLVPALQGLVERLTRSTGVPCALSLQVDPLQPIPAARASAAYRIVQESLTNALRHARPRALRVRLVVAAAALEASVSDDGCGMQPVDMTRAGMGLFGMSERAAALGGRLHIDSQPGAGTTVRLQLPLC